MFVSVVSITERVVNGFILPLMESSFDSELRHVRLVSFVKLLDAVLQRLSVVSAVSMHICVHHPDRFLQTLRDGPTRFLC